jgi:alpha-beta hydrolase superfamily lysophospholipase
MQIVSTRGVGQYAPGEIHTILYHRLDPLVQDAKIGVVLAHGLLGNGNIDTSQDYIEALIARRIPVIGTDLGGPINWGNEDCVARMNDTITYFNQIAGARTDRVVLLGASMGAASVLNWARNWQNTAAGSGNDFANLSLVAGVALWAPALDMEDIFDNDRGSLAATISTAYSGYTGGWATQAATANSANYAAGYLGSSIRIWYSTDDPICLESTITTFGAASGATLTSLGAVGHSVNGMDVEDFADWVAAQA